MYSLLMRPRFSSLLGVIFSFMIVGPEISPPSKCLVLFFNFCGDYYPQTGCMFKPAQFEFDYVLLGHFPLEL